MRSALSLPLALWSIGSTIAHADATLVYGLTGPGTEPTEKKISISQFFVRVDDSTDKGNYLLFQAGKFFPLYRVSESQQTYTLLTPPVKPTLRAGSAQRRTDEPEAEQAPESTDAADTPTTAQSEPHAAGDNTPADAKAAVAPTTKAEEENTASAAPGAAAPDPETPSVALAALEPSPTLRPTRKTRSVAGIECREVIESIDAKPIVEHCMANKARLGITERESRTLARLFVEAREQNYDWLGAATADEDFVSVQSRDLRRNKTLELQSVSTAPLPTGYLRIPKTFKRIEASADSAPATVGEEPKADSPQPASSEPQ
jgi:hypothetical protein